MEEVKAKVNMIRKWLAKCESSRINMSENQFFSKD